jgi:hypothetical protein
MISQTTLRAVFAGTIQQESSRSSAAIFSSRCRRGAFLATWFKQISLRLIPFRSNRPACRRFAT